MVDILVADDERIIRESLKSLLSAEGWNVRTARDGEEALRKFHERNPDLVLLDIEMPKKNGFRVCEEIRRVNRKLPIVFLTANATDLNEVRGLGLGADDFLDKEAPVEVQIAHLRRAIDRAAEVASPNDSPMKINLGSVTVDLAKYCVLHEDGSREDLTRTEGNLLRMLVEARGAHLETNALINHLRGASYVCETSLLSVHMSNIRRKLGEAGALLVCDRRLGYRLIV